MIKIHPNIQQKPMASTAIANSTKFRNREKKRIEFDV